jgi:hypothetical protein
MDREILRILAEGAAAELRRDTVSFQNVLVSLPKRSIDNKEISVAVSLANTWQSDGHPIYFGALPPGSSPEENDEILRNIRKGAADGVFLINAPRHGVRLIVVKASDGQSFFGKDKFRYHCYLSLDDSDQVIAIGTTSVWLLALTKLSGILRQPL